jgi:flavin reductase (DIM6/NTAB) family NADH-FMN oxidoreductase RutF
LAWYVVKATKIIPAGDHKMVLCNIEKLGRDPKKQPLLYYSGKYL